MSTLARPRRRLLPLILGAALQSGPTLAEALSLRMVRACDDANEWPPFTYLARPTPATETAARPAAAAAVPEVKGYSVEVLRRLLAPLGIALQIELLPWVRCLREVESGQTYLMALNVSANPQRRQRFWLSQPYNWTTPGYFYSRQRFPHGVPVRKKEDLTAYQVCGVHGYNYSAYGLSDAQVDRSALSLTRVIDKLLVDRCELGLGELEELQAARELGRPLAKAPELGHAPVPGMARVEFHLLVSRQHPQGQALVEALDRGLRGLRDSGELEAIRRRHVH